MTRDKAAVLAGELGELPDLLREAGISSAGECRDPLEALSLAAVAGAGAIIASGPASIELAGRLEALDSAERPALIVYAPNSRAERLLDAVICRDAEGVIAAARRACADRTGSDPELRAEIAALLDRICLSTGRSEHRYVYAALTMMASDPDLPGLEPEILYPRLARRFNVTEGRVSAAIDSAVRSVWRRCDAETLSEIFHTTSRPSAGEFLQTLFGVLYGRMGRKIWQFS